MDTPRGAWRRRAGGERARGGAAGGGSAGGEAGALTTSYSMCAQSRGLPRGPPESHPLTAHSRWMRGVCLRWDVWWACRGRVVGVSWACRGRVVDVSWPEPSPAHRSSPAAPPNPNPLLLTANCCCYYILPASPLHRSSPAAPPIPSTKTRGRPSPSHDLRREIAPEMTISVARGARRRA